ncbi:hypothetical protein B9Z55_011767 [Caenorhabditis nigoni]|uniref:Uncharacterized protein n=1 Tax=Caenorhabditis nigoni TaxID=1611254 RepID=A0A2G5ULL5_9PELO|nr:hypothetical protein B9Z55_011767 [Caenorhabditis nigoni]
MVICAPPNSQSILNEINGEWQIVSTTNVSKYLETQKSSSPRFQNILFEHSNVSFKISNKKIQESRKIGSQVLEESENFLEEKRTLPRIKIYRTIENDTLKTTKIEYFQDSRKTKSYETKFIKNGNLNIVNGIFSKTGHQRETIECRRIYKRVQRNPEIPESSIFGTWKLLACQGAEKSWDAENLEISKVQIFNEIHIKRFDKKNLQPEIQIFKTGETVIFENGEMATVENQEKTIYSVKNRLLFVTFYKNNNQEFSMIYERV